jgi:hypothetical protein
LSNLDFLLIPKVYTDKKTIDNAAIARISDMIFSIETSVAKRLDIRVCTGLRG